MKYVIGTLAWAFLVVIAAHLLEVGLTWRVAMLFGIANILSAVIDGVTFNRR